MNWCAPLLRAFNCRISIYLLVISEPYSMFYSPFFLLFFEANGDASCRSLQRSTSTLDDSGATSTFCGIQLARTAITRLKCGGRRGGADGPMGVAGGRAHLALDWLRLL